MTTTWQDETEWTKAGGDHCPACGSEDGQYWGPLEIEGTNAIQECSCDCGAEWRAVYVLDGYVADSQGDNGNG